MTVGYTLNIIAFILNVIAWVSIGLISFHIYKKKASKLKIWKVIVVLFIGIFSFNINWSMFDTVVMLPILPLGVWILYFVFKQKEGRWERYRLYAWLGFGANVVFIATTLLAVPLQSAFYPEREATTYLSNLEYASLIPIHPSATEQKINKVALENQLPNMTVEMIYIQDWYEETYMEMESNERNERFPYQLTGVTSKWGSGKKPVTYIESDGKGLLIKTVEKDVYFRAAKSFLEEVK
ncbi:hypothetical protein M3175_13495 [Robertmurraya korlensis]|uniref:hypothetical protein n=1 Tax=Robertmurraya korlensis TaxID=519977 RepID=UPI00203DDE1E|nr:hypothetical protein [Robertmurraya korlensis]MCM3601751.1 hypothetical protein [Robertmurraya korlensis]